MTFRPVLIVDDDAFMRDLGQIQLEAAGFSVETCDNGADALALTRAHDFDLVIADIAMPQMSGLEFLAALRVQTLHRHTPVIVLSAWTSEEVQNAAIRLGAVWLNKPATAAALGAWAERLTSGPTLAQEAS